MKETSDGSGILSEPILTTQPRKSHSFERRPERKSHRLSFETDLNMIFIGRETKTETDTGQRDRGIVRQIDRVTKPHHNVASVDSMAVVLKGKYCTPSSYIGKCTNAGKLSRGSPPERRRRRPI